MYTYREYGSATRTSRRDRLSRRRTLILGLFLALLAGLGAVAVQVLGPQAPAYAAELDPVWEDDFTPVQTGGGEDIAPSADDVELAFSSVTPVDYTIVSDGSVYAPAYYLYYRYTGFIGPCYPDRIGTYQGEYYVPIYTWSTSVGNVRFYQNVYKYSKTYSNYKYTYYEQRGFTTAYRYSGCYLSHPAYRYYGAHKVSRMMAYVQTCWSGSCNPGSWVYYSWRHYWE